jgi:hypothetical protein
MLLCIGQTMDEVIQVSTTLPHCRLSITITDFQVVNHAKVKNLIEAGKKDFSVHNDSIIFSADVVAKFKRPTA